ncbi:hypothetical protein EJ576_21980 [Pseudomonas sp. C 49-2]|uniref:hypothetical protein n=1 Tax=Pseudomonas sp. C 49-2 TaxID=2496849 RepID=UPI000F833FDF|nr:hypothetical protein [Pseudomonas sp. C 49-2]RTX96398.1 hypothetical protein EJ576_21980 [Pseudomonas sp. C 49-2]
MKKSILAIALSITALTSTAQAGFMYQLPLEVKGGGSLPNGTISFGNPVVSPPVTEPSIPDPVEPSIPVIPDLYGKVDPTCNPFLEGNRDTIDLSNREQDWGNGFSDNNYPDGGTNSYIPCKLKPSEDSKVIARFMHILPTAADECTNDILVSSNNCKVWGRVAVFNYKVTKLTGGGYNLQSSMVDIQSLFHGVVSKGFAMSDVDRIEFDGVPCSNLTYLVTELGFFKLTSTTPYSGCTFPLTHDQLMEKANKEFLIEIFKK